MMHKAFSVDSLDSVSQGATTDHAVKAHVPTWYRDLHHSLLTLNGSAPRSTSKWGRGRQSATQGATRRSDSTEALTSRDVTSPVAGQPTSTVSAQPVQINRTAIKRTYIGESSIRDRTQSTPTYHTSTTSKYKPEVLPDTLVLETAEVQLTNDRHADQEVYTSTITLRPSITTQTSQNNQEVEQPDTHLNPNHNHETTSAGHNHTTSVQLEHDQNNISTSGAKLYRNDSNTTTAQLDTRSLNHGQMNSFVDAQLGGHPGSSRSPAALPVSGNQDKTSIRTTEGKTSQSVNHVNQRQISNFLDEDDDVFGDDSTAEYSSRGSWHGNEAAANISSTGPEGMTVVLGGTSSTSRTTDQQDNVPKSKQSETDKSVRPRRSGSKTVRFIDEFSDDKHGQHEVQRPQLDQTTFETSESPRAYSAQHLLAKFRALESASKSAATPDKSTKKVERAEVQRRDSGQGVKPLSYSQQSSKHDRPQSSNENTTTAGRSVDEDGLIRTAANKGIGDEIDQIDAGRTQQSKSDVPSPTTQGRFPDSKNMDVTVQGHIAITKDKDTGLQIASQSRPAPTDIVRSVDTSSHNTSSTVNQSTDNDTPNSSGHAAVMQQWEDAARKSSESTSQRETDEVDGERPKFTVTRDMLAKFKMMEAQANSTRAEQTPRKREFRWQVKETRPIHRPGLIVLGDRPTCLQAARRRSWDDITDELRDADARATDELPPPAYTKSMVAKFLSMQDLSTMSSNSTRAEMTGTRKSLGDFTADGGEADTELPPPNYTRTLLQQFRSLEDRSAKPPLPRVQLRMDTSQSVGARRETSVAVHDVVRSTDTATCPDELPPLDYTRSVVAKFRSLEVGHGDKTEKLPTAATTSRTTKGVRYRETDQPKYNGENTAGECNNNEQTSNNAYRAISQSSVDAKHDNNTSHCAGTAEPLTPQHDELPPPHHTKSLLAKFRSLEKSSTVETSGATVAHRATTNDRDMNSM